MDVRTQGPHCRVTGAAGVIDKTIVRALQAQGATTIGADMVTTPEGQQQLDVTSEQYWRALVGKVAANHARLDILVNCAGIAPMAGIEATGSDLWRKAMAVNVEGAAIGMTQFLPLLKAAVGAHRTGPVIINLASAASPRPAPFSAA